MRWAEGAALDDVRPLMSTQQTGHSVPEKAPGSWHGVVLGDPTGTGSTNTFPVPDLGDACVCCNSADAEPTSYDASTGPFIGEPIRIPLCAACRAHVHLDEKRTLYVVSAAFIGLLIAIFSFFVHVLLAPIGTVIVLGSLGVLFVDRRKQRRMSESGHHSGLEIAAGPGVCSVRTMNRRVAQHLVTAHQGGILRVK